MTAILRGNIEKWIKNVIKHFLSFLLILQYGLIGWVEAFTEYKFDDNFKDNSLYAALISLLFFFAIEIVIAYNMYQKKDIQIKDFNPEN